MLSDKVQKNRMTSNEGLQDSERQQDRVLSNKDQKNSMTSNEGQ